MVMLQNTTFWNYALPHILDRKSPIYKANKYKICHSCLQENITLQAWKCHYFPLILPTGSLPTVPGTSFNLVGALELITLPLKVTRGSKHWGEVSNSPLNTLQAAKGKTTRLWKLTDYLYSSKYTYSQLTRPCTHLFATCILQKT